MPNKISNDDDLRATEIGGWLGFWLYRALLNNTAELRLNVQPSNFTENMGLNRENPIRIVQGLSMHKLCYLSVEKDTFLERNPGAVAAGCLALIVPESRKERKKKLLDNRESFDGRP